MNAKPQHSGAGQAAAGSAAAAGSGNAAGNAKPSGKPQHSGAGQAAAGSGNAAGNAKPSAKPQHSGAGQAAAGSGSAAGNAAGNAKQAAGYLAAEHCLRPGMKVGMGTGSTAIHTAIRTVQLIAAGKLDGIKLVATSFQTQVYLEEQGVRVYSMNDPEIAGTLDITIDGADQVDPNFTLIKGGGAAQLREKIAAYNSQQFFIVVDQGKLVEKLGLGFSVPLEIVPEARAAILARLALLPLQAELRMAQRKAGPVVTDNGGLILDIHFPGGIEAASGRSIPEMERFLDGLPGAMANGIFTRAVSGVFVGRADGTAELLSP